MIRYTYTISLDDRNVAVGRQYKTLYGAKTSAKRLAKQRIVRVWRHTDDECWGVLVGQFGKRTKMPKAERRIVRFERWCKSLDVDRDIATKRRSLAQSVVDDAARDWYRCVESQRFIGGELKHSTNKGEDHACLLRARTAEAYFARRLDAARAALTEAEAQERAATVKARYAWSELHELKFPKCAC